MGDRRCPAWREALTAHSLKAGLPSCRLAGCLRWLPPRHNRMLLLVHWDVSGTSELKTPALAHGWSIYMAPFLEHCHWWYIATAESLQSCPILQPHRRQPTRLPRPWDSLGKNIGVGCHFLLQCMKVKSESEIAQSCPTLIDPMDCSPPGSPVPGILQARTLEWGAISFSNAWKWKVKVKLLSCVRPSAIPWTAAFQAPPSMGFSRQEYWSGVPLPCPMVYYLVTKTVRKSFSPSSECGNWSTENERVGTPVFKEFINMGCKSRAVGTILSLRMNLPMHRDLARNNLDTHSVEKASLLKSQPVNFSWGFL